MARLQADIMDVIGFASAEIALSLPLRWRCHRRWAKVLDTTEKMLYKTANWCYKHGSGRPAPSDRLMTRFPRLWHYLVYNTIIKWRRRESK